MKRVALTFIGKDRPGIVAKISQALYGSGCNIEDATMTILEGEFAMILIALLPNPSVEKKLKKAYGLLKNRWGLYNFWKILPARKRLIKKHPARTKAFLISVIGKDRTGIVYETSRILARMRLNITDLNSKLSGITAQPLFAMMLEVDTPMRFNSQKLDSAFKALSRKMGVDVKIRPLEQLSL